MTCLGTLTMFWVKTAFRVGWDTSFQPLGWATSSTAALSLWRERASGTRETERKRHTQSPSKAWIKSCTRQWSAMNKSILGCKRFGFTVWHRPVFSLSLCQSFEGSRRREVDRLEQRCVIVDTDRVECLDHFPLSLRLDPLLWSGLFV